MLSPLQLVENAKKTITECDTQAVCNAINQKSLLIDLREPNEFQQGFISHAINIPRGLIEFAIFDHPQVKLQLNVDISTTPIYIYCKSGGRSALAAESLEKLGFKSVYSLAGGIQDWEGNGLTINTTNEYKY